MGCGASSGSKASQEQSSTSAKDDEVEPASATWATKTDVNKLAAGSNEQKAVVSKNESIQGTSHPTHLTMSDADDESDVEIIYEGKKQTSKSPRLDAGLSAANAQEPPDALDASDISDNATKPKNPEPVLLSKRQQEEAAKLEEKRKRFDNQRYQQGQQGQQGTNNVTAGPKASFNTPMMQYQQQQPRHEPHQVMGLNFSSLNDGSNDLLVQDLPPGAILGDTPRTDVQIPFKSKNNHDRFDDDEEMFMQEILDTCG